MIHTEVLPTSTPSSQISYQDKSKKRPTASLKVQNKVSNEKHEMTHKLVESQAESQLTYTERIQVEDGESQPLRFGIDGQVILKGELGASDSEEEEGSNQPMTKLVSKTNSVKIQFNLDATASQSPFCLEGTAQFGSRKTEKTELVMKQEKDEQDE